MRAAALALLALLAADPAAAAKRVLRVCADPNNLPFSNERGEGLDNALAALVAEDLGAELEWAWHPQRRGFVRNTLGAGLCDVMMEAPTSYELVATTAPLYRSSYVFVTRKESGVAVRSFDDPALRTLRIGVQVAGDDYANTPPAHALARRGIVAHVVGFPLTGDYGQPDPPARILDALVAGEIDVAIAWGPLAGWYAKRAKAPLALAPVEPQIDVPFLPFVFDISMGVRRGEDAFRAELDAVIARRRPEIERLLDRFGVPRVAERKLEVAAAGPALAGPAGGPGAAAARAAAAAALAPAEPPPRAGGERIFVSNERAGTVSVIDAETLRVVATVPVGGRPRGIQAAADGKTVYVAVSRPRDNLDPGFPEGVVAIDAEQLRATKLSAVGRDPECFVVGASPPRLYVANEDSGTASITDLGAGTVLATLLVGVEPEGVAMSPDERWVYVTAETSNTVSVIDTHAANVVGHFLVEARPRAAAFSRDGRFAFVTAEVGRAVSVVDVARHAVIGTYRFPEALQRPVGVVVSPDGERAYVATGRAHSVAVLDARDPRRPVLAAEVKVGERPWGVALGSGGRRLYSANGGSNDVSVIDTASLEVVAKIPVGDGPWGLAVAPAP